MPEGCDWGDGVIITWLVKGVTVLLSGFFSILPSWTMPSWLSSGTAFPSGVASSIGGLLEPARNFLPIDTILTVAASIFTLWPLIIGFLIFEWVWKHVPTIAGFGTGDG